jgi:hypothetical protein
MKPSVPVVIIATMAVIIAALVWALIYFARDELHLGAKAPEDEIPVHSSVSSAEGFSQVKVTTASQEASGIASRVLEAARADAAAEVYGVIVNVQPFIELRTRYVSAVSDARALRAAAANSATEYKRLKKLFEDDRNVSERAVQVAEAAWRADEARLIAADQTVAAAHASIQVNWGEVLARWATDPDSPAFQAVAQQREALVQLTLPYGLQAQAGGAPISLAPIAAPVEARAARFISAAPLTDATLPGVTYFYLVSAAGLRVGMRVAGQLKLGGKARDGVIVPSAAVVWHGGKAWAYVKEEDDLFVRKEVSTSQELASGWFDAGHFEPGDEVVVSGAQLLLSEELKFQIRNENED